MVSDEIRAAQEAYAARPFAVRWVESHFAATNRFDSYDEAFAYIQRSWAGIRKDVASRRHRESLLWQSYLETPEGRVSLDFVLLAADVSSY